MQVLRESRVPSLLQLTLTGFLGAALAFSFLQPSVGAQNAPAASNDADLFRRLAEQVRKSDEAERAITQFQPNAAAERAVKAEAAGFDGRFKITELLAADGARVEAGAEIAKLQATGLDKAIEAATTSAEEAERKLREARFELEAQHFTSEADIARARMKLEEARRERAYWDEFGRADAIEGARSRVTGQEDSLDNQMDELRQLERLYAGNELATESQDIVLKRARRGVERTRTRLEMERHNLKRFMENDLPEREATVTANVRRMEIDLERQGPKRREAIEKREEAVTKAEKALADARKKLEDLGRITDPIVLKAPVTGIVVHGSRSQSDGLTSSIRSGATIKAGDVLATVIDTGSWNAVVQIPYEHSIHLTAGSELPAFSANWKGRVLLEDMGYIVRDGAVTARVKITGDHARGILIGQQLSIDWNQVRKELGK